MASLYPTMRLWSVILVLEILSIQHFTKYSSTAAEIGRVKCITIIDRRESWKAQDECMKDVRDKKEKKDLMDFSWVDTASFDDFVLDKKYKCVPQCVYDKLGVPLTPEGLPDKKDTLTLWSGNTTANRVELVTKTWDACIDLAAKLGKPGNWDKCKMIAVHDMCFSRKFYEATEELENREC